MLKVTRRNRHKYPPCPECGAVGAKGFTTTKLGNYYTLKGHKVEHNCLRCRNCNAMFTFEFDKKYNVKLGKNLGD